MTSDRIPTSLVAVSGADAIVGHALELVLRSAGFSARFHSEPSLIEPGRLNGVKLLVLFAPRLDSGRRKALLRLIDERPSGSRIRVLELIDSAQGEQVGDRYFVPWPWRAEELMRWVTAALVGRFETAEDYPEGGDEDDQVWLRTLKAPQKPA